MKIKTILCGVSLALLVVACKPKDADIQKEITTIIGTTPGMEVVVDKGVATISGVCKDEASKANYETLIKAVKGVKSVVNNCEVAAPEPVVTPTVEVNADSVLNTAVNGILKAYTGVNAVVKDGVVTLTGTTTKAQLPILIQTLQQLKPKKVDNKLTVK